MVENLRTTGENDVLFQYRGLLIQVFLVSLSESGVLVRLSWGYPFAVASARLAPAKSALYIRMAIHTEKSEWGI